MASFSFSSGDPTHLTGGTTANMTDISGPFADLKAQLNNNPILDYGNFAATVDQYYKTIRERFGFSGGLTAGVAVLGAAGTVTPITTVGSAGGVFYLDSAQYPTGSRTAKLRLAVSNLVNSTAPGINYTYGLYPVTAVANPGANAPSITGLGAVVAGSAIAINAPGAQSLNHVEGAEFSFPTAGFYTLGIATSGSEAANSVPGHNAMLQFRAV